jgi:RHS repeat-associated protein
MKPAVTYPPSAPRSDLGRYRYFFNGQESDAEAYGSGSLHAFEYRMHDTRIGRFWSVDPLAGKFPWNSTYAFAENRVVDGRELEGLEWNPNKPLTTTNEQISIQVVSASDNTNVATTNDSWPQTNPCGEIKEPKTLSRFELWLEAPSKSTVDYTFKSIVNFGYSYVNGPYSLFSGKTISGSFLTPKQRMDAFVDFAPGIMLKSLTFSGQIIRTGNGLQGYNNFVRKNKAMGTLPKQADLPAGVKWQTKTGEMFHLNISNEQMLDETNLHLKSINFARPFTNNYIFPEQSQPESQTKTKQ